VFDSHAPQRYTAGDTIRIGLHLHDESSVGEVVGLFVHSANPDAQITLRGNGGGQQRTTVSIDAVVGDDTQPGQYFCKYVHAHDDYGNHSVLHPDIVFYVDQRPSVEEQGPELEGWGFLPES
jgi:hypothetical protein